MSGGLSKEDLSACLPHLYAALEDRSAEVRRSATDAVLPFLIHLGYDAMARHAGKLKVRAAPPLTQRMQRLDVWTGSGRLKTGTNFDF